MMKTLLSLVCFLLVPGVVFAADGSTYERVLIPLHLSGVPGAFGTVWSTELAVRNEGDSPALIFDQVCWYECHCGTNECVLFAPTAPGSAARFIAGAHEFDQTFPGVLVHVERARAAGVAFNLRLYEESRRATEFGIEVPVVREPEFRTSTTWLINVPMVDTSRVHLRVYGLESPSGQGVVRVRVLPGDASDPSYDQLLTIEAAPFEGRIPAPGDDDAIIPGMSLLYLTPPVAAGADTVRISVEPVTPGLRFWTMASVTSNTTQNVTLITPQ